MAEFRDICSQSFIVHTKPLQSAIDSFELCFQITDGGLEILFTLCCLLQEALLMMHPWLLVPAQISVVFGQSLNKGQSTLSTSTAKSAHDSILCGMGVCLFVSLLALSLLIFFKESVMHLEWLGLVI